MSVSPFDSALYRDLFGDAEIARLFSDTAEIRAMMLTLGALAKAQGAQGVIPEVSAAFLHRAMMEVQVDPGGLARATGANGVTVPGLIAALRTDLQAPEHAQYLHWGATSQDIQDTALMLRLRQALVLIEARIGAALDALAHLAEAHAETPQAARTYGQVATPSSFGALAASWGSPLMRLHDRLEALRPRVLCVSLSGAAGTASMLGPEPVALRTALAEALGLGDPRESWHAGRDRIGELGGWLADLTTACGKMGADLTILTRSEIGEVSCRVRAGPPPCRRNRTRWRPPCWSHWPVTPRPRRQSCRVPLSTPRRGTARRGSPSGWRCHRSLPLPPAPSPSRAIWRRVLRSAPTPWPVTSTIPWA
jgi:3-carboxy-cis,cis-muconate cycloisomerase